MKQKILVLSIVFFQVLSSCIPGQKHYNVLLAIKNNSDKSIYYNYSRSYPDTSLNNFGYLAPGLTRTPSQIVNPGQQFNAITAPTDLDNFFTSVPLGKLEVFIYDVNIVNTTPWDTVAAKYLVLKRYDLTVDDLKKTNGVVSYP